MDTEKIFDDKYYSDRAIIRAIVHAATVPLARSPDAFRETLQREGYDFVAYKTDIPSPKPVTRRCRQPNIPEEEKNEVKENI